MEPDRPRRLELDFDPRALVFGFGVTTGTVFGLEAWLGLGPVVVRYLHRP